MNKYRIAIGYTENDEWKELEKTSDNLLELEKEFFLFKLNDEEVDWGFISYNCCNQESCDHMPGDNNFPELIHSINFDYLKDDDDDPEVDAMLWRQSCQQVLERD